MKLFLPEVEPKVKGKNTMDERRDRCDSERHIAGDRRACYFGRTVFFFKEQR